MPQQRSRPGVTSLLVRGGWCLSTLLLLAFWAPVLRSEDVVPPPVVVPPEVALPEEKAPLVVPVPDPLDLIIPEALLLNDDEAGAVGEAVDPPEIALPHAPAKPGAMILRWDRYRTLVVIDHSAGLMKPCWIVTLSTMPEQIPTPRGLVTLARGQVVVAYRGQAYLDKDNILHIDARRAKLAGVMATDWSPDSFAITPAKEVSSRDDNPTHPSNAGEVEKEVSAETQREEYRRLMFTAMAIVEGNI